MTELGRFDTDLQMFVDAPQPVRMQSLLFNRWLAENGRFGRLPLSAPSGEYAQDLSVWTGLPINSAVDGAFTLSMMKSKEAMLRKRIAETGDY